MLLNVIAALLLALYCVTERGGGWRALLIPVVVGTILAAHATHDALERPRKKE